MVEVTLIRNGGDLDTKFEENKNCEKNEPISLKKTEIIIPCNIGNVVTHLGT